MEEVTIYLNGTEFFHGDHIPNSKTDLPDIYDYEYDSLVGIEEESYDTSVCNK